MITSTANDRIKHVVKLSQRARLRKEEGLFVCDGRRLVCDIEPERIKEIYYTGAAADDPELSKWLDDRIGEGIFVTEVSEAVMKKMSDTMHPQGILAVAQIKSYDIHEMLLLPKPMLLILDHLQDPGNLGTLFRTAEAAGVAGIITGKDTADWYSPKVVRASMGSILRLPHVIADDICSCIRSLRELDFELNCTLLSDESIAYDTIDYTKKCAIVIGNEGEGVRKEISSLCSSLIHIPMQGKTESLNASAAAAVILFEAARQRRNPS